MPHKSANTFVAGDANAGGGYGTLNTTLLGSETSAEQFWPYRGLTDYEAEEFDEELDDSRIAISKGKKSRGIDHLQQTNYKSSSFVNGSTRGLTGIMAGRILKLAVCLNEDGFIAGLGQGSTSHNMMGPFDSRTRPGRRTGSKKGWFTPIPKPSDPEEPAYTLRQIADVEDEPTKRADLEKDKNTKKKEVLRDYVKLCIMTI